jgi:amino acid transporter
MSDDLKQAAARRGSFMQTVSAVGWSFFGVRRSADHAEDVRKLNPLHVIAAGIVGAAIFIAVLVMLVRWVIASGVAAG